MKCAIYCRVSTTEQSTDNQLQALETFAEHRGWQITEVYSESESAWKQGHQRELARLLDDIRSGKRRYDYLVVWSLDRLSRQGIAATLQLINSFELYGCKVVSLQESWIAEAGPMREVFAAMAAWAAKFESDRRSERTKAGLERRRRDGTPIGTRGKDKAPRKRSGYLRRWEGK